MVYSKDMEIEDERDAMLEQLVILNAKIAQQNSISRIFFTGIVYGIGFFVGSAILATISLGILSPWLAEVDWIRDTFDRGSSLR